MVVYSVEITCAISSCLEKIINCCIQHQDHLRCLLLFGKNNQLLYTALRSLALSPLVKIITVVYSVEITCAISSCLGK